MPGIADCFVGLASIAAASGSAEHAAQLLCAAEPHLDAMRGYMPLSDRATYEHTLAVVVAQLETTAFTTAFAHGRGLALDQAITVAKAEPRSPTQDAPVPSAPGAAAPAAYPAGLTKREVEVLRLVAQGLTDAQVAERLVISTRTVNGHLRSIYNKLDVSSRTAAARFASAHRLL